MEISEELQELKNSKNDKKYNFIKTYLFLIILL